MKKIKNIFEAVEIAKSQEELNECIHQKIDESILDIPQKKPATWLISEDGHFNKEIRQQIYRILRKWRDQINFKFDIEKIEAKGSLVGGRFYNPETADLDITVFVSMTQEQIDSVWEIIPQGNKIIVDGVETKHPIDFFLVTKDHETNLNNVDALFDVGEDKWIKKPVEYKNDIPMNYLLGVCNFFINGCSIAITNYKNDKTIYEFYKSADPELQEITQDEKDKAIADKKLNLKADLDALRLSNHMMASFRREAYDENNPQIFGISIETITDNKHVSLNEQIEKLLEKLGIRQEIKRCIDECSQLLEADLPHEEAIKS